MEQDELTQTELAGLRVTSRIQIDHRDLDTWAYKDDFITDFIASLGSRQQSRAYIWKRAIDLYWRQRLTQRHLAAELSLSFDGTKSLLKTIRKAAETFQKNGAVRTGDYDPVLPHVSKGFCRTIGKAEILGLLDPYDEETKQFVEEYGRLEIEKIEQLKAPFREDPFDAGFFDFKGRSLFPFSEDLRFRNPAKRGRPAKPKIFTVKRRRGRPKKYALIEEISLAEKHIVPCTADFSADLSLPPEKSELPDRELSCLNIATQQSEPLTLGA